MVQVDRKWIQGTLTGKLRLVSGLHVGGRPSSADGVLITPFVRDQSGRPFVPGSTLKGALRSQAQIAIKSVVDGTNGQIWACDFPDSLEDKSLSFCLRDGSDSRPCTVCNLFGSTGCPARVVARDLNLLNEWSESLMQHRSTLGVSRTLGRGVVGSERRIELVPPGLDFGFEILVSEPLDWELGLLLWVIERLGEGFGLLGGGRRLGLGRVKMELSEIAIQRLAGGLSIEADTYIARPATPARGETEPSKEQELIGIPKPSTDDMGAVLYYCLKLKEVRATQADAGEIGKLLSSEFGLSKRRRKELGLPEKVSELLDEMVRDNKLHKNYLGHYSIPAGYIHQPASRPSEGAEPVRRHDLDDFREKCKAALHRVLFEGAEAADGA